MEVISLNVGQPVTVGYRGKPLETGIYKQPASGPVRLHAEGFDGDGQADLVNHGGPDKAVCVYPVEHYAYWEEQLDKKLEYSAFGENLTVSGLLETGMCTRSVQRSCRSASPAFLALSSRRSTARPICRPRCWLRGTAASISACCARVRLLPVT